MDTRFSRASLRVEELAAEAAAKYSYRLIWGEVDWTVEGNFMELSGGRTNGIWGFTCSCRPSDHYVMIPIPSGPVMGRDGYQVHTNGVSRVYAGEERPTLARYLQECCLRDAPLEAELLADLISEWYLDLIEEVCNPTPWAGETD